jgi:hypothetical protein
MKVVWLVVALALGTMGYLAYQNSQKVNRQLAQIEQDGFVLTEDFQGEPKLIYDESKRQLAFVFSDKHYILPIEELISSEVLYDLDKRGEKNYRLELITRANAIPKIEVKYRDEFLAERIHKRLRALKFAQPSLGE